MSQLKKMMISFAWTGLPAFVGVGALTHEAANFLSNLRRLPDEGRYIVSWTHPWQECGSEFAERGADGRWCARNLDTISLNGYVKAHTGHDPLVYFTDFYCCIGTWLNDSTYERNMANMEGFIRKAYDEWHSVPVFSWHIENPYAPNERDLPSGAKGCAYRYRHSCEGYPQEHRYVIREILEGSGGVCGTGRAKGAELADAPSFPNPRAWYDAQLDKVCAFLRRLKNREGRPIPCVVRLFHEMEDGWSWWGADSVSSSDYKAIFRYTAAELRRRTGLMSLLFLYSPDRYWKDEPDFMLRYPGDDVVDIIGFDDYSIGVGPDKWAGDKREGVKNALNETIDRMRIVSRIARERGKAAGIVETGVFGAIEETYEIFRRLMRTEGMAFSFFNTWGGDYTVPRSEAGRDSWRAVLRKPDMLTVGKGYDPVSPGGSWVKFAGNPVLGGEHLGTCYDVNVVTNGPAPYTMYFSWRPKKAIALVRSDDAVRWTPEPEICLEANPSSGWEERVNRSCTVFKDGVWHMWYTGQANGMSKIGYAMSKDGVRFERVRRDPVLVPEASFEKQSVMNPYVRWDEKRGVWRMWYAAGETYEPNVMCHAESKDGLIWTKYKGNPVFGRGESDSWDRDRVGGCEVHPLLDGRWAMFYIGYSDIDTARIGCAVSDDGLTGWRRLSVNPIVVPDVGAWDGSAVYKPSAVCDVGNNRWLLYYNGRSGFPEYVGCAMHDGLDLESPSVPPSDTKAILSEYVRRFNAMDDELYTNAIPNAVAEEFLLANAPRFACPDKDIERTYYFRWWTFRKHLRRGRDGGWRVTEFMPDVPWSGADNTIVCSAGHHFREGRWLRDPQYLVGNARFWLSSPDAVHRWKYSSWLFTGMCQLAEASGLDSLPIELLDDAVKHYTRWEEGFDVPLWPSRETGRMGGDGNGGFLSSDNREGTELSLGGNGWKPLMNSAMWSEAKCIAAIARKAGRMDLATEFEAKAASVRRALMERCWNGELGFFTTRAYGGVVGDVRELHGYAPWYFGVDVDVRPDWSQLSDPMGFAAKYGLSFPERRAGGFAIAYEGHECQWNGPSWPFATSIALTALANDLHANPSPAGRRTFDFLMWQYAAQHKRTHPQKEDWKVVPWIDENLNPDRPDWISRTILGGRKAKPEERGKDYNHSTFCDLVISGVVGFIPAGEKGFAVCPLADPSWDWFVLDDLRYRGHDVSIRYRRGEGLSVSVDGKDVAARADMGRLDVALSSNTTDGITIRKDAK